MTGVAVKLIGFVALLCLAFGLGVALGAAVDPVAMDRGESVGHR